jgi:hypothetical protein
MTLPLRLLPSAEDELRQLFSDRDDTAKHLARIDQDIAERVRAYSHRKGQPFMRTEAVRLELGR